MRFDPRVELQKVLDVHRLPTDQLDRDLVLLVRYRRHLLAGQDKVGRIVSMNALKESHEIDGHEN